MMTGQRRFLLITALLALLLAMGILTATAMGYIAVNGLDVARIIRARLTGQLPVAGLEPMLSLVVLEVRLPRILTAVAVGGGLAVAGVVFQGILHNPLADPYTLGISSGAAFGASLALLLEISLFGSYSVPLFAFAGALVTLAAVLYLASFDGQMRSDTMVLAGVIVGAILTAGISFMKYQADEQVSVIIFWLMGSFASRSWQHAAAAGLAAALGFLVVFAYGRDLDILTLGDRSATSLGVEANRVRRVLLITASLVAAVCVSVSGIIGFVGLIVPHLMRFLVGPGNRRLAAASFLAGGVLLLAADTVSRTALPREVPVGVLTALLGGPFFCYIFRRRRGGWL